MLGISKVDVAKPHHLFDKLSFVRVEQEHFAMPKKIMHFVNKLVLYIILLTVAISAQPQVKKGHPSEKPTSGKPPIVVTSHDKLEFSDFQKKALQLIEAAKQPQKSNRTDLERGLFVTAARVKPFTNDQMMAFSFTEKLENGTVQSKITFAYPPFVLRDLYAQALGGSAKILPEAFAFRPVLLDESLFKSSLHFSSRLGIDVSETQDIAIIFGGRPVPVGRVNIDGKEHVFQLLKEPALLRKLPPKEEKYISQLEHSPFQKQNFSVINFEGNSDSVNVLSKAKKSGLNIAMNLPDYGVIDNNTLGVLENQFRLRSGRTIAIFGHYEGGDFVVRLAGKEVGKVAMKTMLDWSTKYNVSLVALGCRTAQPSGDSSVGVGALKDINSYDASVALARALSSATWGDFLAALSSKNMPLLLNDFSAETKNDLVILADLVRSSSSQSNKIAVVLFFLKCNMLGHC